jgi:hypothetical protein
MTFGRRRVRVSEETPWVGWPRRNIWPGRLKGEAYEPGWQLKPRQEADFPA